MNKWPSDRGASKPMPEISGYRLSREIGHGGMSTVYLGTQLSLGREVAIKVMLPDALADEVSRRRFENEARTIARLEHPNIVGIYEVGRTAEGLPWYSMPHLPRGHVGERDLRNDEARVREILRTLLSALAFAHARGVIHRDVKAENVLFDEADRPLLADFGIALRRGHGTRVTMTGLAVGSTAYMAPEQARGQQVDHRADLYSVGVLAWEMLNRELPYKADDALAMAIQHAQSPLPKLPVHLRHWQRFMDRALAKSPRKRFNDAQQMLQALDAIPIGGKGGAGRLRSFAGRSAAALRHMPKLAWIPIVLVCAAGIGLLLRDPRTDSPVVADDANAQASALPGPPSTAATPIGAPADDPDSALHRAAPQSPVEQQLQRMQRHIAAGRLLAPDGDSAADSLVAAWRADREHLQLPQATDTLFAALADETVRAIEKGRDAEASTLLRGSAQLRKELGDAAVPAMDGYRDTIANALAVRMDRASRQLDRPAATHALEHARLAGLPKAAIDRLQARAAAIPDLAGRNPGKLDGMVVVRDGDHVFAGFKSPVSRAEYARFAEVNGRATALCRERASLLRVLAPRDWTAPGFEQADGDPVVCVSWEDAEAYAQWRGRRDGRRYRLATVAEAAKLPATGGERAIAEWRSDCADQCRRRKVTGASWRGGDASRALDPLRGFDDVGFRLALDL